MAHGELHGRKIGAQEGIGGKFALKQRRNGRQVVVPALADPGNVFLQRLVLRVDAEEVWLWHAGGPLALTVSPPDGKGASATMLGPDLRAGQRPQFVIPAHCWQTAETLGHWTLVSCIVAPGFEFSGFTLAPKDWRPEV